MEGRRRNTRKKQHKTDGLECGSAAWWFVGECAAEPHAILPDECFSLHLKFRNVRPFGPIERGGTLFVKDTSDGRADKV